MHSDWARQGTVIFKTDREHGAMRVVAVASNPRLAEEILKALQSTELPIEDVNSDV